MKMKTTLGFIINNYLLQSVWCAGQAGTIVYSRDNNCIGKEFIRSFTGQCTSYINKETKKYEYMKFSCSKNTGFVTVQSYSDNECLTKNGNAIEVVSNYRGDGSCQQIMGFQYNYLSAQLYCDESDSNIKSSISSNILENKITLRYYTNEDATCGKYPSVIEMWSEDICLYYESLGLLTHEAYASTGMYAIYSEEVSESGWGNAGVKPSVVSARYFNTNDCRFHVDGPIEGDPPPGGIGSPVRHLRNLQGIHVCYKNS